MRILRTYFALLQAHPHQIMGASWLPADKQKMTEIFKLLLLAGPDNELGKKLEDRWCLLSHFQPVLVQCSSTLRCPTTKEWRERKERVEKWLEIAIAEDEKYEREIERFKVSNKTRH